VRKPSAEIGIEVKVSRPLAGIRLLPLRGEDTFSWKWHWGNGLTTSCRSCLLPL